MGAGKYQIYFSCWTLEHDNLICNDIYLLLSYSNIIRLVRYLDNEIWIGHKKLLITYLSIPVNVRLSSIGVHRSWLHALFFAMLELKYQYIAPVEVPICKFSESLANVIQMLHSRPLAEFSLRVQWLAIS